MKTNQSVPEDEIVDEGHPFALPQIVEIDNILNKSLLKSKTKSEVHLIVIL